MKPKYTKRQIDVEIASKMKYGISNEYIKECFIMRLMENDLCQYIEEDDSLKVPDLEKVYMTLRDSGAIPEANLIFISNRVSQKITHELKVQFNPYYCIRIMIFGSSTCFWLNDSNTASFIAFKAPTEVVALWLKEQYGKFDSYHEKWDEALKTVSKQKKSRHLAFLAISTIVEEEFKKYPDLKYVIKEQKNRARIGVRIPNMKLNAWFHLYWGTYAEKMPKCLENIETLLDMQDKLDGITFSSGKL